MLEFVYTQTCMQLSYVSDIYIMNVGYLIINVVAILPSNDFAASFL